MYIARYHVYQDQIVFQAVKELYLLLHHHQSLLYIVSLVSNPCNNICNILAL
jgi:hypothetical protein